MTQLEKTSVSGGVLPVKPGTKRTNPLAHVFDELVRFAQSKSLFMLHYCTG